MTMGSQAIKRDRDAFSLADMSEADTLMRRFLNHSQGHPAGNVAPEPISTATHDAHPRRDFDMASDLLDRASQAFELLINRCQRLERNLNEANEHATTQAAEQEVVIEQWKRLATGLKAQIDASDGAMSAMKQRCDAAEARAAMAEQRASALERASAQAAGHAALAESLSIKLHDKVVSAFGIGSRAHPVLEVVATQQAAE